MMDRTLVVVMENGAGEERHVEHLVADAPTRLIEFALSNGLHHTDDGQDEAFLERLRIELFIREKGWR